MLAMAVVVLLVVCPISHNGVIPAHSAGVLWVATLVEIFVVVLVLCGGQHEGYGQDKAHKERAGEQIGCAINT